MKRIWNEVLTVLAVCFLVAFSYPAFKSDISASQQNYIDLVQWICWLAFALDLAFGIISAENKKSYLKHHPLEIASVLLPFLRPLRLMRVISFGGLAIQKIAIGRQFAITLKVVLTSIFVAYIAAVQITITERSVEGSNIKSFSDGLWWATTTVTTVGYGDRYPTTSEGRFLAVLLMIVGISLIGVITASVAAWFVKISNNEEKVS
ncbi:Potassium channel domain containing protein [Candidatus Nanopelagicaceae bacterium]